MTGRQLYNYLLTSADGGLEMYASGFGRDASAAVKDVQFGERVYIMCSKVEAGEEQSPPMKAGRLFKSLHRHLGESRMEKDVIAKTKTSREWMVAQRVVDAVGEAPCYKGRALCFITSPAR